MADTNKRSGGVKNTDYVNYDWNGSGENTNYVNSIKVLNSLKKVVTMAIHSTETVIPNMKNAKFVEILKQQVGRYTEFAKRCDELADKIGTTQPRVSEWENDKVEPTLYNVIRIVDALRVSFEDLTEDVTA